MLSVTDSAASIYIGKAGEHNFRTVSINISAWKNKYPQAEYTAIFCRPDGVAYPIMTRISGNAMYWSPQAEDTYPGIGQLEVRVSNNDLIGKSTIFQTVCEHTLTFPVVPKPPSTPSETTTGQILIWNGDHAEWKPLSIDEKLYNGLSLTQNPADGKIYIAVNGTMVGQGVTAGPPASYGNVEVDNMILRLNNGQSVTFNVRLSEPPTNPQIVTILSDSEHITFDKSKLTFTADNYDTYQTVTASATNVTEDQTAHIIIRNSDVLMTDTYMTVYLVADFYNVDTTIPEGAHVCTVDDFESVGNTNSGANFRWLGAYTGEYTNIIVPAKMTIDGTEYDVIVRGYSTFYGNTALQYVQFEEGVGFSPYGANGRSWESVFYGCTALVGVRYTGNDITSLNETFYGCTNLKFFDGLEKQTQVTSLKSAFYQCSALEYLPDLSGLTKVTTMYTMAWQCYNLKKVYGWPAAFEIACTMHAAFFSCTSLEKGIIPVNATPATDAFKNCTGLKRCEIYNDDLTTSTLNAGTFTGVDNLEVYCNADTSTQEALLSLYGSSTTVSVLVFGGGGLPSIVVWGDSTTSPGVGWKCWPDRLQEKLGTDEYLVKNEAVSGEFTTSTSARQGGNAISVAAFAIPADETAVGITMTSEDGQTFGSSPVFSCGGSFNPCVIAGVEGTISRASATYSFARRTAGEAVEVPAGTIVESRADALLNAADNVMIVELGNNAGWNEDPAVLLNQAQLMVDHFTANGSDKYIIFGPFSGQFMRTEERREKVMEFEGLAKTAFGDHFISIREYLIENGLSDNGLTASDLDTSRMALGQIPASLICGGTETDIKMYDGVTVTDDSHPNAYGAHSIMLGIYAKGVSLGYWT